MIDFKRSTRNLVSLALSAALLIQGIPVSAFDQGLPQEAYLEEVHITDEILAGDLFYFGSKEARIPENGGIKYLLRVARGGDALNESTALIKIADLTARYGEDYTVSVRDSAEKVDNPEENLSLMDRMAGSDFTQSDLADVDEFAAALETDEEGQELLKEGLDTAVEYLSDKSGLSDKLSDGTESVTIVEEDNENLDPVQEARNRFTGDDTVSQRLLTEQTTSDAFQELQSIANVMTDAVVGAKVELTFKPGEKEKYLEINPKNNFTGDGDRMFYFILGAPTGTTTNSAASACAVTIVDDEESEPSVISFSDSVYEPEEGADMVTITVVRTGSLSKVASCTVKTGDKGSALEGRDYSKVERSLFFPFGVDSLTLDIPIRTEYFRGEKNFFLEITPEAGCETELSSAEVRLNGTWSEEASENDSEAEELPPEEAGELSSTGDSKKKALVAENNTLTTVRTLDSIKVDQPYHKGHRDNQFTGDNHYDSNKKRWVMCWEAKRGVFHQDNPKGTVGVCYKLTDDDKPYWIGGALVRMDRTKHHAEVRAEISGYEHNWYHSFADCWDYGRKDKFFSYVSTENFNERDYCVYPSPEDCKDNYSLILKYLYLANHGNCADCNYLYVYDVKPILRPFLFTYEAPAKLKFKDESGKEVEDDSDAIAGDIVAGNDGGSYLVLFLGDSFTVEQKTGSNTQRYATMNSLEITPGDGKYYPLWGTKSVDGKSCSFDLTKDSITRIITGVLDGNGKTVAEGIGEDGFYNANKDNAEITDKLGKGAPKYVDFHVRPTFDKINSAVNLVNPYDFPVTVTIDGTDYDLKANENRDLGDTYYLGDKLYTSVSLSGEAANLYSPVGVDIKYKYNASDPDTAFYSDTKHFMNGKPVYISGTKDDRLNYQVLTIEPNLQKKENKIVIRVKTADLSRFVTESGVLKDGTGTVNGDYTEFDYAPAGQTANGKLYPIPVIPRDDKKTVCRWYDNNAKKYYEGNTLYFTAGNDADKNLVSLSAVDVNYNVVLSGTLMYSTYDLKTLESGKNLSLPASGAIVSAGSGSALADDDGRFSTLPVPVHGSDSKDNPVYLRYMVSVNGNPIVKETVLQDRQAEIDVSSAFHEGVDPAASDIFRGVQISCEYDQKSAYHVEDNYFLPIDEGSQISMTVNIKPSKYTSTDVSGDGSVTEEEKDETPESIQFQVYDAKGKKKGRFDAVKGTFDAYGGYYVFKAPVFFSVEDDNNPSNSFATVPGDMLYMRVKTDRDGLDYTYSDVYTGYTFKAKNTYTPPVVQGITSPVNINYDKLDFLKDSGMKLDFPFVTVGYVKTERGYRMYIGAGTMQVVDYIKESHYTYFKGDDGQYWHDLFSMSDPVNTFKNGLRESYNTAFKDKDGIKSAVQSGSLGHPTWRFDISVGIYFDFELPEVSSDGQTTDSSDFLFTGLGGYVSVDFDVKQAWYFILPVVFIPAYLGIEVDGTVLGFFGAKAKDDVKITYDDSKVATVSFDTALDQPSYNVNGTGIIQLSAGIGLCGTIGVRATGAFKTIVNYNPTDATESDWGLYMEFRVGIEVDLFLASVPYSRKLAGFEYGSFKEYAKNAGAGSDDNVMSTGTVNEDDPFVFRDGSGLDPVWLGSKDDEGTGGLDSTGSAFAPSAEQSKVILNNAYERSDSQLITLHNGTIVLAFVNGDNAKGKYQRTTLMIATYKDGRWSEPVPVVNDDTADFQPSICEMKDGKVMVAWVSTAEDNIDGQSGTEVYLKSMDVYAAIAEIDADGKVKMSDAQRLTHDKVSPDDDGKVYYDCKPTVVCDMVSGDAMVYYIKSGREDCTAVDLANPYTNDSVISYMPYSYKGVEVTRDGKKVTEHWLFDYFYDGEVAGDTPEEVKKNEQYLIDNFGGQRFLDSPSFTDGKQQKTFAIPDFTAVGYNSLAVFAYSVDRDGTMDTDTDREMFLQVYDFKTHQTKYKIMLTDDDVADTMPQLFRGKVVTEKDADDATDTKLFWYRDHKSLCFIDVSRLLSEGIDSDGNILPVGDEDEGNIGDGKPRTYADPTYVCMAADGSDTHASRHMADFRVTQDDKGSIYILWTDGVGTGREIFATSLLTSGIVHDDNENGEDSEGNSSAWSRPYQITREGHNNDEIAVTLDGDDLMVVHNQFDQELDVDNLQNPISLTDMKLVATVLEPCGAVEVEDLTVVYPERKDGRGDVVAELPMGGSEVRIFADVVNMGLTPARGVKAVLKEVDTSGNERTISENTISYSGSGLTPLNPSGRETISFNGYTLPQHIDGLVFKVETSELMEDGTPYGNHHEYVSDPLVERGDYEFTNLKPYQLPDGFHLAGNITNYGNAPASEEDKAGVVLSGPYNMELKYSNEKRELADIPLNGLGPGESIHFDVPVSVGQDMLSEYGHIQASVAVRREHVYTPGDESGYKETSKVILGDLETVYFEKEIPLGLKVSHLILDVDEEEIPVVTDAEGNVYEDRELVFSIDDPSVARMLNGRVVGLTEGRTEINAVHTFTGATVKAPVIVGDGLRDDIPDSIELEDIPDGLWYADLDQTEYSYTGKKIMPEVEVFDNLKLLQKGRDYTVSYRNNVNAYVLKEGDPGFDKGKAPRIIIKGKGNYTDSVVIYFTILPVELGDEYVEADDMAYPYNGKQIKVKPLVRWNGKKLKPGKDFTVPDAQLSIQDMGDHRLTLTGIGNFTGSRDMVVTVYDKTRNSLISKLTIGKVFNQSYTGEEVRPEILVRNGMTALSGNVLGSGADCDYYVSYGRNIDAGTAYALVKGNPNRGYVGTKRIPFRIVGTSLKGAIATGLPKDGYAYTGKAVTLDEVLKDEKVIMVTRDGKKLKLSDGTEKGENYSFTVSYENNVNSGTATAILTGKGGCEGTLKLPFRISRVDVNSLSVNIVNDTAPYAKGGSSPDVIVRYRNKKIREGRDYVLLCKGNKKAGDKSTAILKGQGNFCGQITFDYTTVLCDMNTLDLAADDLIYKDKAGNYLTRVSVAGADGKKLKAGTDYEKDVQYTYEDGSPVDKAAKVPAGTTIRVTLKAMDGGNYKGEVTGTYRVAAGSISKVGLNGKIADREYTGKKVTLSENDIPMSIPAEKDGVRSWEIADYRNNVNKGTASVTLRGLGDLGGKRKLKFRIKAKGMKWSDVKSSTF